MSADEQAQRRKKEAEHISARRIKFQIAGLGRSLSKQFCDEPVFLGFAEVRGLIDFFGTYILINNKAENS